MASRIHNGICKEQKLVDAKGRQLTKKFDPEKYGMTVCSVCQGQGFTENDVGRNVCIKCGGFGLIKKEEDHGENR